MATKVYDVVAVTGTYTDRSGEEKKRYLTCGAVFQSDKGLSVKLECIPVGFNGWFSLYEPKEHGQDKPKAKVASHSADEIPF